MTDQTSLNIGIKEVYDRYSKNYLCWNSQVSIHDKGLSSVKWPAIPTAQKVEFFIRHFFSKCNQIRSFLRVCSHLPKKSLMENFIFCAVTIAAETLLEKTSSLRFSHKSVWIFEQAIFQSICQQQLLWIPITVGTKIGDKGLLWKIKLPSSGRHFHHLVKMQRCTENESFH